MFFCFSLDCFVLVLFPFCVRFSFFTTETRDGLGITSPKCPILRRVGCELNQSVLLKHLCYTGDNGHGYNDNVSIVLLMLCRFSVT